jgi:hypothetical protein
MFMWRCCIMSCDRAASWHVTVLHRDMWPCCIVTCDRAASWHVTVLRRDIFLCNKTNQMHQFPEFTLGWNSYMFLTVPLPIIRNLFTVHSTMVYVIQICRQLSSRTSPARKLVGFIVKELLNYFRIRINLFLQHWIFPSSVQLWMLQYITPKYIISIMMNIIVGVRGKHDDLLVKIMLCKHFWTSAHSHSIWCFCHGWVTAHAYLHILHFGI